jgi:hypothetical protein
MSANGVALVPNVVGYTSMPRHAYELGEVLKKPEVAFVSPRTYQEWLPRNNVYANRKDLKVKMGGENSAEREGFDPAVPRKYLMHQQIPCNPPLGTDLAVVYMVSPSRANLYGSLWK